MARRRKASIGLAFLAFTVPVPCKAIFTSETPDIQIAAAAAPEPAVATPKLTPAALSMPTTIVPAAMPLAPPSAVIPPGGALPSDAECAKRVVKTQEVRPENNTPNHTAGSAKSSSGLAATSSMYSQHISGNFKGTTDEIIQWAACKWGFDSDPVRAQAMVESSWHQMSMGGFVTDTGNCSDKSLRRVATSSTSSTSTTVEPATTTSTSTVQTEESTTTTTSAVTYECPTAFGLLQIRSDYHPGTYPMSRNSTAFNVDYALAMERACFDGASFMGAQTKGDYWGCVGAFYSGNWHNAAADGYAAHVQDVAQSRGWPHAK